MKRNKRRLSALFLLGALLLAACLMAGCTTKTTTFTVRFLAEDGSEINVQTIESGGTLAVPKNPAKEGYAFSGWLLDGEPYDFTAEGARTVTKDLTFVAGWEKNTWTVSFWDGETQVSSQEVAPGGRAVAPEYTKPGYTVLGWCKEGSDTLFNFNAKITEDLQLQVSAAINRYTVRFFDEDGQTPIGGELAEQVLEYGAAIAAPTPANREYATFLGWRTADDAEPRDLTDAVVSAGNTDYMAVWQYQTVRVTFYDEDGVTVLAVVETRMNAVPVYDGATPEKSTGDGRVWVFVGWDRDLAPATEETSYTAAFNLIVMETDGDFDSYEDDLNW